MLEILDRNIHPQDPARNAFTITPSNSDLAEIPRSLYVGSGGDLVIETINGDVVTFVNVVGGCILPIFVKQVRLGTTASSIIGLF